MRAASEIIDHHVLPFPIPFLFICYLHAAVSAHQQGLNKGFLLLLLDINRVESTICVPPKLLLTLCPHWEIPFKTHVSIHTLVPLTLPPVHPHAIIYIQCYRSPPFLLSLALHPMSSFFSA